LKFLEFRLVELLAGAANARSPGNVAQK